MEVPETRYVERPDGVSIAYQVWGEGPRHLVYVPGFISHLDLAWTEPRYSAFLRRMGSFARVVTFDKPGTGLSDPIGHIPTFEERAEDIRLVMDAAGVERATIMGFSEGVSSSIMLAATRPERVERLILYGGLIKGLPTPDELEEYGFTKEEATRKWARVEQALDDWGRGRTLEVFLPSANSALDRRFWALFERAAASPKMARGLIEAVKAMDVAPLLESVHAPTLLIHNRDDFVPLANSRIMAARIPDSRLVELPGPDHAFWMNADPEPVLGEIEQFVTGSRRAAQTDRVLATVLFTDVVGSTQRAAELGDARWREALERHERLVREHVAAARGRVVKSMGDGHLSVFDGPARAIRCALALIEAAELPLRAGVHTGECEAIADDLGGLAVHIGARVSGFAGAGEVLVSNTVKDLVVGSGFGFADRGEHELKGVPGRWRLHAVREGQEPEAVPVERELRPGDRLALRMANRAPHRMRSAARVALRMSR